MIPHQLKLRTMPRQNNSISTEYGNSRKKIYTPKNQHKLTYGKQKYDEIKCSHTKGC